MRDLAFAWLFVGLLAGCSAQSSRLPLQSEAEVVAEERAKLSPEDRALVAAQDRCVISTSHALGSMGAPLKLEIEGQAVFVCCAGCTKKAQADPAKTLAKLAELKARPR